MTWVANHWTHNVSHCDWFFRVSTYFCYPPYCLLFVRNINSHLKKHTRQMYVVSSLNCWYIHFLLTSSIFSGLKSIHWEFVSAPEFHIGNLISTDTSIRKQRPNTYLLELKFEGEAFTGNLTFSGMATLSRDKNAEATALSLPAKLTASFLYLLFLSRCHLTMGCWWASACCLSAPLAGVSLLTFLSVFEHPLKTCSQLQFHLSVFIKNSNGICDTTIHREIENSHFLLSKM